MLWNLKVTNSKTKDKLSFSAHIRLIGPTLVEVLNGSGVLDPIPGTDFKTWRASLTGAGKAWDSRGCAGLEAGQVADVIFDLHDNVKPPQQQAPQLPERPSGEKPFQDQGDDPRPAPIGSYIHYECSGRVKRDWRVAVQKVLQATSKKLPGLPDIAKLAEVAAALGGQFLPGPAGAVINIMQRIGNPAVEVIVKGKGLRLGLPVPIPIPTSIGDIKVGEGPNDARLTFSDPDSKVVGKVGGLAIFAARWTLIFSLPREPLGRVGAEANPMLKFEDHPNDLPG